MEIQACYAAENGHAECIQVLAEMKASISNELGFSFPLAQAARNGNENCLCLLVSLDANINKTDTSVDLSEATALMQAAENGHLDSFALLIAQIDCGHGKQKWICCIYCILHCGWTGVSWCTNTQSNPTTGFHLLPAVPEPAASRTRQTGSSPIDLDPA